MAGIKLPSGFFIRFSNQTAFNVKALGPSNSGILRTLKVLLRRWKGLTDRTYSLDLEIAARFSCITQIKIAEPNGTAPETAIATLEEARRTQRHSGKRAAVLPRSPRQANNPRCASGTRILVRMKGPALAPKPQQFQECAEVRYCATAGTLARCSARRHGPAALPCAPPRRRIQMAVRSSASTLQPGQKQSSRR